MKGESEGGRGKGEGEQRRRKGERLRKRGLNPLSLTLNSNLSIIKSLDLGNWSKRTWQLSRALHLSSVVLDL